MSLSRSPSAVWDLGRQTPSCSLGFEKGRARQTTSHPVRSGELGLGFNLPVGTPYHTGSPLGAHFLQPAADSIYSDLQGILSYASLPTGAITSQNTANERDAMIKKFNNPKSDIEILIINQNTLMAGLNFHHCCRVGITLQ